jgi:cell division protein FtsB
VGIAVQGSVVDREKRSLLEEIAALERANAEKREEIERRNTDDYVVETARDYGYVRPGEGLIAVEGDEPGEASVADLPGFDGRRILRWWNVFFGAR